MSLESANRWSKIGMIVGGALLLVLFVANFSVWATTGAPLLVRPFDSLANLTAAMLILSSVFLWVGAGLMRGQRQVLAEIIAEARRLHGEPATTAERVAVRLAEAEAEGLSPESLAIGRRLSERLNGNHG